jgi:hypothetical protein
MPIKLADIGWNENCLLSTWNAKFSYIYRFYEPEPYDCRESWKCWQASGRMFKFRQRRLRCCSAAGRFSKWQFVNKMTFRPILLGARANAWQRLVCTRFHACADDWRLWVGSGSNRLNGVTGSRNLFLLGKNDLKFDLSVVERRSKHGILKSRYQLGEFHHLCNELRKHYAKFFWVLQKVAFNSLLCIYCVYICQHISHNIRRRKNICGTEISPICLTFNTINSVPWWNQSDPLLDCYIHNDSNKYIGRQNNACGKVNTSTVSWLHDLQ